MFTHLHHTDFLLFKFLHVGGVIGASREDFEAFAKRHSKESTNGNVDTCYVVDMFLEDIVDDDSSVTRLRVRILVASARMLSNDSDIVCADGTYKVTIENVVLVVMGDSDSDRRYDSTG